MKRLLYILLIGAAFLTLSSYTKSIKFNVESAGGTSNTLTLDQREQKFSAYTQSIYECINEPTLSLEAFSYALKGHYALKNTGKLKNEDQLIVIDFNMSSSKERFFIIDLENETVVYKKLVAHGKNSGSIFPTKFSNIKESRMSSLGFYVTGNTYNGKYDNSLLILGQEKTNNKARERGVVIHSADYATKKYLEKNGRLGRSFGCPALPHKDYEEIISCIKNGTTLFIYYKDKKYLKSSKYLKREKYLQSFY